MSTPAQEPAAIFNSLARIYTGRLDIKLGTFGDGPSLSSAGTLFAALPDDELIVRLPPERCAMLVDAGEGRLYVAGDGQTYEDWFVVPGDDAAKWKSFVTEALGCARGG